MLAKSTPSGDLLNLVENYPNHFWAGEHPLFSWNSARILASTNFRLSSSHHQRYDVVWFYETLLSDLSFGQVELVLDELLRLVGVEGRLVVRYRQNKSFSIIGLKHFLGRRHNVSIEVEAEQSDGDIFTTAFTVNRQNLDIYQDKRWTFAVLTSGKRKDNMLRFLHSIRSQDRDHNHEILICGPRDPDYARFNVDYLDQVYREELAEISRKKNDIADRASHANLLIAHDRYVLNDDFFTGFDQYGYDFDFIAIKQWYETGEEFPGYCALSSSRLVWSPPIHCKDLNRLYDLQYINGGLIVAKTRTLRELRLNPLLFWNQAEDLELAKNFRDHGLPPRINVFSSANTVGITPQHTKSFRIDNGRHVRSWLVEPMRKIQGRTLLLGKHVERYVRRIFKPLKT